MHFSGIYQSGGKRIGLLRIPDFTPASETGAILELFTELVLLNTLTDGLVVDITRNPGGGCYGAAALELMIPWEFDLPADEIRATLEMLALFDQDLQLLRDLQRPEYEIRHMEFLIGQVRTALNENRGRTGPIPFCGDAFQHSPLRDRSGNLLGYLKPMIVLTDEFTISWGDIFAATIQDNGRGPLFGYRTNGAGGSVGASPAGFFSETITSLSLTMGVRHRVIGFEDLGAANTIENTGVRPEIPYDYMTEENLLNGGASFVAAFTEAMIAHIDSESRAR
jgi:C-terminal processing protease CtpA/Prc